MTIRTYKVTLDQLKAKADEGYAGKGLYVNHGDSEHFIG